MLLGGVRAVFVLLAGLVAWYVVRYLGETQPSPGEALLYSLAASAAAATCGERSSENRIVIAWALLLR